MKRMKMGIVLLVLGMMAAGCTKPLGNAQQIGVVDVNRVFQESRAGQEGMQYLQGINDQFQQEFGQMQGQEQTEESAQKMQEAITRYQGRIEQEQQRVVGILNERFQRLLEEYRERNNFSVLLSKETVISSSDELEITDEIIEEFDQLDIDLSPPEESGSIAPESPQNGTENGTQQTE
ncbi:MAG: OmpH family outer membrane protein [bacterium]